MRLGTGSEFIPAKDIDGANRYAREILGVRADYNGVDVRVANEWNARLKEEFERFPELKDCIRFVGEIHERNKLIEFSITEHYKKHLAGVEPETIKNLVTVAMLDFEIGDSLIAQSLSERDKEEVARYNGITLNLEYARDYTRLEYQMVQENAVLENWPEGRGARYTVDHEIAHQLDCLLGISGDQRIKNWRDELSDKEINDNLSVYAWQNESDNPYSEFVAEAWAEYRGSSNPRLIAKTVGEMIERIYEEWKEKKR